MNKPDTVGQKLPDPSNVKSLEQSNTWRQRAVEVRWWGGRMGNECLMGTGCHSGRWKVLEMPK